MTRCQVWGCEETATARCDNGFAVCSEHRAHNHGKQEISGQARLIRPRFRSITPTGEYFSGRPR